MFSCWLIRIFTHNGLSDVNFLFVFQRVRTPGGKLTIHYLPKIASKPKCGDTGRPLFGLSVVRPKKLMRIPKGKKTVSRCYGGVLSGYAVRNR